MACASSSLNEFSGTFSDKTSDFFAVIPARTGVSSDDVWGNNVAEKAAILSAVRLRFEMYGDRDPKRESGEVGLGLATGRGEVPLPVPVTWLADQGAAARARLGLPRVPNVL